MPPKGRGKSGKIFCLLSLEGKNYNFFCKQIIIGGGAKVGWEAELTQAELSDSQWNCQVHFLLGEDPKA